MAGTGTGASLRPCLSLRGPFQESTEFTSIILPVTPALRGAFVLTTSLASSPRCWPPQGKRVNGLGFANRPHGAGNIPLGPTNTRDGEPNGRRRAPFLSRAWPRSRSGSREPKGALCRVVPGGARRQLTKGRCRMPDDAVYPRFLFGAGPFLPLLLLEVTPSSPQTPPSSAPFLSPLGGARRSSSAQAGTAWTSTECSSGLLATQV